MTDDDWWRPSKGGGYPFPRYPWGPKLLRLLSLKMLKQDLKIASRDLQNMYRIQERDVRERADPRDLDMLEKMITARRLEIAMIEQVIREKEAEDAQ